MSEEREPPSSGDYESKEPPARRLLREAAPVAMPEDAHLRVVGGREPRALDHGRKGGRKVKTSVYLEPRDVDRLSWLSEVESRPQAEIIRDAIRAYHPRPNERKFHVFDTFEGDGRSIADIPDDELFAGMGDDAWSFEEDALGRTDR